MNEWELSDGKDQVGLLDEAHVIRMIDAGLSPATMIRRAGQTDWTSLRSHAPFAMAQQAGPAMSQQTGQVLLAALARFTAQGQLPGSQPGAPCAPQVQVQSYGAQPGAPYPPQAQVQSYGSQPGAPQPPQAQVQSYGQHVQAPGQPYGSQLGAPYPHGFPVAHATPPPAYAPQPPPQSSFSGRHLLSGLFVAGLGAWLLMAYIPAHDYGNLPSDLRGAAHYAGQAVNGDLYPPSVISKLNFVAGLLIILGLLEIVLFTFKRRPT